MSKLSPKPDNARPLLGWKELDKRLQASLSKGNADNRFLVIEIADFEMSADEIQTEAESQGYVVSYPDDRHMRFE